MDEPAVKPLRIVHIITRFIRGGADENTLLTCNGQAALGYEVHLVVGAETHPDILAMVDPRVQVHEIRHLLREISPLSDARAFLTLYQLFRLIRPQIVHTHESKAGILGRWAAWIARVPVVVHGVHILAFVGAPAMSGMVYRIVERVTALITHAFVDVSEGMKTECLAAGVGNEDNHYVVPSGMQISRFRDRPQIKDWRDVVDPSQISPDVLSGGDPDFVLIAGALEPRKRIGEFVSVFRRVAARQAAAVLLIAGDGYLMEELKEKILSAGLRGRVIPLGYRSDIERLIGVSKICVHMAEREGLPRVVVQYVAAGRPAVTTALPGIERIVRHGVNGFHVPLDDIGAAEQHLIALLESGELRESFCRASREIDLSDWSADEMVRRISVIYRDLGGTRAEEEDASVDRTQGKTEV